MVRQAAEETTAAMKIDAAAENLPTGFAPVCTDAAAVLILGSFPGRMSLGKQQYYGHPRNGFWPIMSRLLDFDNDLAYQLKLQQLQKNRIGLWDVLARCRRPGSLDSSIVAGSLVINDFKRFFADHPDLRMVAFNGARAETEFRKRVLGNLSLDTGKLVLARLPSTSPAMATLSFEQKVQAWSVITRVLRQDCCGNNDEG